MNNKRILLISVLLLTLLVGASAIIVSRVIVQSYWKRKTDRATAIINKNFQDEKAFYTENKKNRQ